MSKKEQTEKPLLEGEALIIEGEYSNILARLQSQGIDPSRAIDLIFMRMGNSIIERSRSHFNELVEAIEEANG